MHRAPDRMSEVLDRLDAAPIPDAETWAAWRAELRAAAEATERERARRLNFALADTGTGLFDIRLSTGRVTADGEARAMFGFADRDHSVSIDDVRAKLHPHDHAVFNQIVRRLLGSERIVDFRLRILGPDGAYRHIDGRAAVDRSDNGRPERIMGLLHDVTGRVAEEVERQQAAKLESIGQLAAGIAHEINTPVQFVSDSVHFIAEADNDLLGLIEQLLELADGVAEGRASADLAIDCLERAGAVDIEYLANELPRAVERAADGLGRVATIVGSMKEFAHPDGAEMTPVDLNRGVQSTLTIAHAEYKYVAELMTDYGELPLVTCHPSAVNQAVLNIVVNAAHAIGDRIAGTSGRGLITVSTRAVGGTALIEISDTGGGIPAEIRHRIFDPFFTTKEVGRGTGQGLAISRRAIEEHGGTITFDVQDGLGTTFAIRIPIDGRPATRPLHQEPRR